jgi:hypothetical protein
VSECAKNNLPYYYSTTTTYYHQTTHTRHVSHSHSLTKSLVGGCNLKSTHRRQVRRSAGSAGGTQNESSKHRNVHRARGGQVGNGNAKKSLEWLESYDLSTPAGIERFLVEAIKALWTGQLGTRQAGALNGALHLLITEGQPLADLEARIRSLEEGKIT